MFNQKLFFRKFADSGITTGKMSARRLHHLKTIVLKTFHIVLHDRIEVHIGVHRRCNDLLTSACKCRRCQHVICDPVCKLSYYIGTCRCDHEKICSLCQ